MTNKRGSAGLVSLILIVLTGALHGQAVRHFQLPSFLMDDHQVTEFHLHFVVNGREINADRKDGYFVVPDDVYEASGEDNGMRFIGNGFDFTLEHILFRGYVETDKVKEDPGLRIDTIPAEIERKHVAFLTKKDKRSLGIRSYKDVCAVYMLTASTTVITGSDMIVDPITTKQYKLCRK
jgi:hypothetical protein